MQLLMTADRLTPWDANFFRRKTSRPSHDHEMVGPMRFFKTAAGPGGTPYPSSGKVYYAELQRDVHFTRTPGAALPAGTGTGHYEYLGDLSGVPIPQGTLVKATKVGARWWIDSRVSGCGCPAYYYSTPSRTPLIICATSGQSQAGGKPNVFAFDADGHLVWSFNTGFFVGSTATLRKVVDGITRDSSGNVYLSYSTGNVATGNFAFGIQKLDKNGNLLQDWTPAGWTIASFGGNARWQTGAQKWQGQANLPNGLFFGSDGFLYWQHIGRQNGSSAIYDCISKLDLGFNEIRSYGRSNFNTTWVSGTTVPICAGRIQVDSGGNIWNEFGDVGGTSVVNACLLKLTNSGSLVFNHATAFTFGQGGYLIFGRAGDAGFTFVGSAGFDINPDSAPPLGYVCAPVTSDYGFSGAGGLTGSAQLANHNAANVQVGWCAGTKDACNNVLGSTPINKQDCILLINNSTVNNTAGQTPQAEKTPCDIAWADGDRLAGLITNPCFWTDVCYTAGRFVLAFASTAGRRVTQTAAGCLGGPAGTYPISSKNGLLSIDGASGVTQVLRSYTDVLNIDPAVDAQLPEMQGLAYLGQAGLLACAGVYEVQPSVGGRVAHITLFGLGAASLSTLWRVDLGTLGPLALDATSVTCVYADRN